MIGSDQLGELARHSGPHSVSLWMPGHAGGPNLRQDPIRLKNLLGRAREQLTALGVRAPEARQRLAPVREAVALRRSAGLGVLLGQEEPPLVLEIPEAPPELVSVCGHFHLKPLFGPLQREWRFYLLMLSENVVRLLRAGPLELETIDLPGAPANFAEFLRFDQFERHLDFHGGTALHQPGRRRPGVFHGQGGGGVDDSGEKRRLLEYCRRIDVEVRKALGEDRKTPLLLAAAEPLEGIFRQATTCGQLDPRVVCGNPDRTEHADLYHQAVSLLKDDFFVQPVRLAVAEYHRLRNAGLASNDLEGVLRAASARAVGTLLVACDRQCWGRYEEGEFRTHDAQQAGDEELLNLAAVLASGGGATVHAVAQADLPDGAPVAATLRFRPDA